MTGRKKDTTKRARIAELLRKGCATEAIMVRVGCGKDLVTFVRQELKGEAK